MSSLGRAQGLRRIGFGGGVAARAGAFADFSLIIAAGARNGLETRLAVATGHCGALVGGGLDQHCQGAGGLAFLITDRADRDGESGILHPINAQERMMRVRKGDGRARGDAREDIAGDRPDSAFQIGVPPQVGLVAISGKIRHVQSSKSDRVGRRPAVKFNKFPCEGKRSCAITAGIFPPRLFAATGSPLQMR